MLLVKLEWELAHTHNAQEIGRQIDKSIKGCMPTPVPYPCTDHDGILWYCTVTDDG